MKLHVWKTVGGLVFCLGATALASAGCSSSSTAGPGSGLPPPAGCTADSTVDCSGGGDGFSCAAGDNPEVEDSTLSCSTPASDGANDDFCCFTFTGGSTTTCVADDSLTSACPDADSYGYKCASVTDDPTTLDPSLNCSGGVADSDGINTDFCCSLGAASTSSGGTTSGGTIPSGCASDTSLDCSGGGEGISCPSGTTPDDSSGVCSVPTDNADGTDGFCCITITDTGCTQDDTVTGSCDYPSYGFSCTSGSPDPSTDDPSLTCSTAVTDPTTNNDDYCCTN